MYSTFDASLQNTFLFEGVFTCLEYALKFITISYFLIKRSCKRILNQNEQDLTRDRILFVILSQYNFK